MGSMGKTGVFHQNHEFQPKPRFKTETASSTWEMTQWCWLRSEFFFRGGEGGFHPLSRFFFEFLGGVSKNFGWFLGFLSFFGGVSNACELGDSRSKLDVGCRWSTELEGGRVFQRLQNTSVSSI